MFLIGTAGVVFAICAGLTVATFIQEQDTRTRIERIVVDRQTDHRALGRVRRELAEAKVLPRQPEETGDAPVAKGVVAGSGKTPHGQPAPEPSGASQETAGPTPTEKGGSDGTPPVSQAPAPPPDEPKPTPGLLEPTLETICSLADHLARLC